MPGTKQEQVKHIDEPGEPIKLTAREQSVLVLVVQGLTNTAIAAKLDLGYETVKTYVDRLRKKLDATTRTDIAVKAIIQKLVDI